MVHLGIERAAKQAGAFYDLSGSQIIFRTGSDIILASLFGSKWMSLSSASHICSMASFAHSLSSSLNMFSITNRHQVMLPWNRRESKEIIDDFLNIARETLPDWG